MLSSVRRCAVVAHFDASRALAPHFRHTLDEIVAVTDRVVLVSTSGVDENGRRWLRSRRSIEFLERPNIGYDFKSLQAGFEALGEVGDAEILFCNDSIIGPLLPLDVVFRTMTSRGLDFWGMTRSVERASHIQSYFMVFTPEVVRSPVFRQFWVDFGTPADRAEAIDKGELRLTTLLEGHGFSSGAYFEPTASDVVLANQRYAHMALPDSIATGSARTWWERTWRSRSTSAHALLFNPTIALADAALDGRLPLLKIEAARLDPWELGGRALGVHLADRHSRMFEDVFEYFSRTDSVYAGRYGRRRLREKHPEIFDEVRYRY